MEIGEGICYVGVNDRALDLFEGQYTVPNGVAYNSYVVLDEKIAVMDSVETRFSAQWLNKIAGAVGERTPDYLVVQHIEPDHSGSITVFMEAYPQAKIVASPRAFVMLKNFFGAELVEKAVAVDEGDTLVLGSHTLRFLTAAMVHWPEVIMTYDEKAKVLFSADAFGKFGALDTEEPWIDEARRYYFGVVGKYGAQVQTVLQKLAGLELCAICPLHGPVLRENLACYLGLYDTWSSYEPEEDGVAIVYSSMYGNTKQAAERLAELLQEKGVRTALRDLSRCDVSEAVADAFRYSKLVLASVTYNGGVFPSMRALIEHLRERGYTKRTVGLVENGSWAPAAAGVMRRMLEKCKDLTYAETSVKLISALSEESAAQLESLAEELCQVNGLAGKWRK